MKHFKDYKCKFMQSIRDALIFVHILKKDTYHSFKNMSLKEYEEAVKIDNTLYAKQLIDLLEGDWSIDFFEALRDECQKKIDNDKN